MKIFEIPPTHKESGVLIVTMKIIDSNGTVDIVWGVGLSADLFVVAAAIKIIVRIMRRILKVLESR